MSVALVLYVCKMINHVCCGRAGCSEHSQICSLALAVLFHHTTPAGMVAPYSKSHCSASGTSQTWAWSIAVSMYAGVLAKTKKGKDCAFWHQFNEKPSIIPNCPGGPLLALSCHVPLSGMLV